MSLRVHPYPPSTPCFWKVAVRNGVGQLMNGFSSSIKFSDFTGCMCTCYVCKCWVLCVECRSQTGTESIGQRPPPTSNLGHPSQDVWLTTPCCGHQLWWPLELPHRGGTIVSLLRQHCYYLGTHNNISFCITWVKMLTISSNESRKHTCF